MNHSLLNKKSINLLITDLMKPLIKAMGMAALVATCAACSTNPRQVLAKQILDDRSLAVVDSMGRAILSQGLNAGSGYSQVWARDMNTFVETACEVTPAEDIRGAILVFFALQQPNGEMVDGYVLKGDFDWEDPHRYYSDAAPDHVAFKNTVETDQETSLIQIVGKYVEKTGDKTILQEEVAGRTVYQRMEDMVSYLMTEKYNESYGLLTGALTADWGDVQPDSVDLCDMNENSITTIDAYDNAMFAIALDYLARMTEGDESAHWEKMRQDIVANTRKHLWDDTQNKIIPHIYPDRKPDLGDFDESKVYYHGGTAIAKRAMAVVIGHVRWAVHSSISLNSSHLVDFSSINFPISATRMDWAVSSSTESVPEQRAASNFFFSASNASISFSICCSSSRSL